MHYISLLSLIVQQTSWDLIISGCLNVQGTFNLHLGLGIDKGLRNQPRTFLKGLKNLRTLDLKTNKLTHLNLSITLDFFQLEPRERDMRICRQPGGRAEAGRQRERQG